MCARYLNLALKVVCTEDGDIVRVFWHDRIHPDGFRREE